MFAEHNFQPLRSPGDGAGFGNAPSGDQISYNPLNRRVGDFVTFTDPDLEGLEATVQQLALNRVVVDGEPFTFTDYDLIAPGTPTTGHLADEDGYVRLRLRCLPLEGGEFESIIFQAQAMNENARSAFNSLVPQPVCTLFDSTGVEHTGFRRIEGATDIYRADRTIVGDPTAATDQESAISSHSISYLDFERTLNPPGEEPYQQWALVEFNLTTKAMVTLFGWSIESHTIN